ncbi:MAG: hypothetical protein JGK07_04070 [Microcoleus sp. PH2017_24_DOB_U_A]|nr:hypothetical protein [Microcoleus sp. PH2017_24_DOB_U_A]
MIAIAHTPGDRLYFHKSQKVYRNYQQQLLKKTKYEFYWSFWCVRKLSVPSPQEGSLPNNVPSQKDEV